MEYITTQEAASKWNVSARTVTRYAKAGKLEGAKYIGGNWIIPVDAVRPKDGRTKEQVELINGLGQMDPLKMNFKFPVYIYSRYYKHKELLSPLEQQLYEAQDLFFAGSYQESYKALQELWPQTVACPLYFRLGCLYYLSIVSIYNEDYDSFKVYSAEMEDILSQDFPYKKEMEAYLPIVSYYYRGLRDTYTFKIDPTYNYDLDVLPIIYHNYFIQRILAYKDGEIIRKQDIYFFELLVRNMIEERSASTGVVLTISLLYLNLLCNDMEVSQYYMDKIIDLAKKGNCPTILIELLQYLGSSFRKRLKLYDKELYIYVVKLWKQHMRGYIKIRKNLGLNCDFVQYTDDEIFLISALAIEHTNAEIADILGVSSGTVSRKITELHEKTGITSRKEYKKMFNQLML